MKTTIQLPPQTQSAMNRLRDDEGMLRSLVPIMDDQVELTLAETRETFFRTSGPQSLGVRTSRLWKSLRQTKAVISGNRIVAAIGSNVKYLGVHEFGFQGTVQVGPYIRKRNVRQVIFGKRRKVRVGDVPVRAHSRQLNFPERAPLRRGIAASHDRIARAMVGGIVEFYKGK